MAKWDNSICCMGDSFTENDTLGVPSHLMYPKVLQDSLNASGANCIARNFGRSGNTTTQMLARFSRMTQFGVPKIGVIYGGENDPGSSITATTTQANIESMIQKLKSAGCSQVLVIAHHYFNFTANGDTLATPYAPRVSIRSAQQTAATNQGAVYVDFYNYLRNRIVANQDTQGAFSWHVADQNAHLNAYGESLLADCIFQTIKAQGWDALLK